MSNNEEILKELREITRDKESWKANIGNIANKLNKYCSIEIKAKALWLLGEMGLKYPLEIEVYVNDIAAYLDDENPKLRERSVNAIEG